MHLYYDFNDKLRKLIENTQNGCNVKEVGFLSSLNIIFRESIMNRVFNRHLTLSILGANKDGLQSANDFNKNTDDVKNLIKEIWNRKYNLSSYISQTDRLKI